MTFAIEKSRSQAKIEEILGIAKNSYALGCQKRRTHQANSAPSAVSRYSIQKKRPRLAKASTQFFKVNVNPLLCFRRAVGTASRELGFVIFLFYAIHRLRNLCFSRDFSRLSSRFFHGKTASRE